MDLQACRRLLLFGGSFDPPHRGHVELPRLAAAAIDADAVAYLPTARQPLKAAADLSPSHHRLAMLRLALAEEPRTAILSAELDRAAAYPNQPSYTIDTLKSLRGPGPDQVQPSTELRLLIGADQVLLFDRWRQWRRIEELAEPVVMLRPPLTRDGLLAALPAALDRQAWERRIVPLPAMDISATDIRRRVRAGLPITGLVHPEVEGYIRRHGLYRE